MKSWLTLPALQADISTIIPTIYFTSIWPLSRLFYGLETSPSDSALNYRQQKFHLGVLLSAGLFLRKSKETTAAKAAVYIEFSKKHGTERDN